MKDNLRRLVPRKYLPLIGDYLCRKCCENSYYLNISEKGYTPPNACRQCNYLKRDIYENTAPYICRGHLFCAYELLEMPVSEIAREMGVCNSTIYNYIKKFKIPPRPRLKVHKKKPYSETIMKTIRVKIKRKKIAETDYKCLDQYLRDNVLEHPLEGTNKMIFLVKSYLKTRMIDGIFNRFKDITVIFDENYFELLIETIEFKDKIKIEKFIKFMNKVTLVDTKLRRKLQPIWLKLRNIFKLIINDMDYTPEKKHELLYNVLRQFTREVTKDQTIKWHNSIKSTIHEHFLGSKSINTNQLPKLLTVINNIRKIKDEELLKKIIVVNIDGTFSYYISNKDLILQLFTKAKKVIITATSLTYNFMKATLPEFKNSIIEVHNNIQPNFEKYNMYSGGELRRYNIIDPRTKERREGYKTALELTKGIIYRHKNDFMAIFSYIIEQNYLKKDLKDVLRPDIAFGTRYALTGKNKFQDYKVAVLFGCSGIGGKPTEAYVSLLNVSTKMVNDHFVKDNMFQEAERIRSVLESGKIVYQISSMINTYIKNVNYFTSIPEYDKREFI